MKTKVYIIYDGRAAFGDTDDAVIFAYDLEDGVATNETRVYES